MENNASITREYALSSEGGSTDSSSDGANRASPRQATRRANDRSNAPSPSTQEGEASENHAHRSTTPSTPVWRPNEPGTLPLLWWRPSTNHAAAAHDPITPAEHAAEIAAERQHAAAETALAQLAVISELHMRNLRLDRRTRELRERGPLGGRGHVRDGVVFGEAEGTWLQNLLARVEGVAAGVAAAGNEYEEQRRRGWRSEQEAIREEEDAEDWAELHGEGEGVVLSEAGVRALGEAGIRVWTTE